MLTEHKTYLSYLSKRKGSALSKVLLYLKSFILLKGIQVQNRKCVVCNQCSSSAISGLQSRGGERWHNYIFLSSLNAACVILGKPCQAC